LNVRNVVDGREVRTIELDAERAPLITWAFDVRTGDWGLRGFAHELEVRGLTQRPTAKRAARPLDAKKLGQVLHNAYYVGTVTWRGMQFDGKHPRLVSFETFARVQDVLAAVRRAVISAQALPRRHAVLRRVRIETDLRRLTRAGRHCLRLLVLHRTPHVQERLPAALPA
jgi:Recombinase